MFFEKRHTFSCRDCGYTLTIKGRNVANKVCNNCCSIHIKNILGTESITGKSFMPEDMTLLCLGAKGNYENRYFEVIGRKRLIFENGYYRNDWYLLFEDESVMWLYESFCSYMICSDKFLVLNYNQVKDVGVNDNIHLPDKNVYTAETIVNFREYQIEGELPDLKYFSSKYYVIELSDSTGAIVFVDLFSKDNIYYSMGKRINFGDFNFLDYRKADEWN